MRRVNCGIASARMEDASDASDVRLVSSDGKEFSIRLSATEDIDLLAGCTGGETIPLAEIDGHILALVAKFLNSKRDSVGDDRFFAALNHTELFGLVQASNYIGAEELIDQSCEAVGNLIRGKSPGGIRELFSAE